MLNIYKQQENNSVSESKKPEVKNADYHDYQDPTGEMDSKKLQYGFWYLKHKVLLYRMSIGFVIFLNVLFWGIGFYKWGVYLYELKDQAAFESQLARANNFTLTQQKFLPKPLEVRSSNIYPGGSNKFDAVAEIVNPNSRFISSFDYSFEISGAKFPGGKLTLMPGQTALATVFGIPEEAANGVLNLQIDNSSWRRLSTRQYPNPENWQSERMNFEVSSFQYSNTNNEDGLKVNRITFNLKNSSAYGYKDPSFNVGLYYQETLVGVMPLQTADLRSMEEKNIDLRNFVNNLQVHEIKIFPLINLYDKNIYLSPEK